jgi:hypothetical protein
MAIALLTTEQHRNVVGRLVSRARQFDGLHYREAGTEYTSLMVCFLLNNVGLAQTLLKALRPIRRGVVSRNSRLCHCEVYV